MKTTQAWGWLAAGVLALGLNGIYHDGGACWARVAVSRVVNQIEERTGPVLALAAGRADLFLARTGMIAAREETASCRLATAVARVRGRIARAQGGFARMEAMSAREEAAMARVEANRARIEAAMTRVRWTPAAFETMRIPVACPRVRVSVPRVSVPRIPVVNVPEIHVNLGAGPV
jgi:hypothetical protein